VTSIKNVILLFFFGYLSVISAAAEEFLEVRVERYEIMGKNPLSQIQTEQVLRPFLGPLKGLQQLQGAVNAFKNALQNEGFGFYTVALAPQTLDSGVVKLAITPLKIRSISVRQGFARKPYFSPENIRASVPS